MDLDTRARDITEWATEKGFWSPPDLMSSCSLGDVKNADLMLGKLMLVVSEIGEAMEAGDDDDNFYEEYADAAIRILHIFGGMGINPSEWLKPLLLVAEPNQILVYLSRAAEAARKHDQDTFLLNLGFTFQIIAIVVHYGGRDLFKEIDKKMAVNRNRPYRHGKVSGV